MRNSSVGDAAIAVVRRNTEEVQGKGNWGLFEELFADDFVDHTPQPGTTPDKDGVRVLYKRLRAAFPDFHPEIHWQAAAGTYDVNEAEGMVLHRVRSSLWPREVGIELRRHVVLTGDRLVLTTPPFQAAGEQRRNRLTWERVR